MKGRDPEGGQVTIVPVTWSDPRARAGGAKRVILQTGDLQVEAVALYERTGYERIATYEPYVTAIPFSLCFEKRLQPRTRPC
jgi:hypothetical protein